MKRTLLMAAFAAFGIVAFAQETYVGQPTDDMWVRFDNGSVKADGGSIEVKNYADEGVNKSFFMVETFRFTAPESGRRIKSATLRVTTRVPRGTRETAIYGLNGIATESSDYATVSSMIEAAMAAAPVAKFTMAGQNNKAIHDGGLSEDYQTVAAWQNTIDLTDYVRGLVSNRFSIVFAKTTAENQSSHLYAKEATGVTWNAEINGGAAIADADLKPQLTVEYEDAPADGRDVIGAAVDGWIMDGWQSYNGTIELKNQQYVENEETKTELFYGVMRFSLPTAPEGKVMSKATLRLVTERCKNDRNTDIYLLGAEVADGKTYADLSAAITAAMAGDKLASFEMAGQSNKAVEYDIVDDTDIAAWTNTINLPIASFKHATTLNLLIAAPVLRDSKNDSNRFFASEQEDVTNTNTNVTYKKADLIPQLIIDYEDAPAEGTDIVKPSADGWIMDGWQSYNGTIELKNQQYVENEETKTELFYGVMHFDMPAVPEGKKLAAATLRLVTERCKNDRNTDIYLLGAEVADGKTYADLSEAITTALAGEKLASFEMVGQYNKAVEYDNVDDTDIASWTNNIVLDVDAIAGKTTLNLLIVAPVQRDSKNDSNRFFALEQEDVTNTNTNVTYKKADLIPQLTLNYEDNGETTAISTVKMDNRNSKGFYTLAGQRVENPVKGIYIHNGKKVVIK